MIGLLWLLPFVQTSGGLYLGFKDRNISNMKFSTRPNNFNNPGNILVPTGKYNGEVSTTNNYKNFESLFYGVQAIYDTLLRYHNQGLTTPRQFIGKYSDAPEPNLTNYLNYVTQNNGYINASQQLSKQELIFWLPEIAARMSGFEQGGDWLNIVNGTSFVKDIYISAQQKYL